MIINIRDRLMPHDRYQTVGIKMVFRNVNADGSVSHLFLSLCLSSEPQCPGIRSGLQEKTRVILL